MLSEEPNGFPLTINDHQSLDEVKLEALLRIELVDPELTVKQYSGIYNSELTMPNPADTTYNGQLKDVALASASRKPLPQYISRAIFSAGAFFRRSSHCFATALIEPVSRLSEVSLRLTNPFFQFVQFVRIIAIMFLTVIYYLFYTILYSY